MIIEFILRRTFIHVSRSAPARCRFHEALGCSEISIERTLNKRKILHVFGRGEVYGIPDALVDVFIAHEVNLICMIGEVIIISTRWKTIIYVRRVYVQCDSGQGHIKIAATHDRVFGNWNGGKNHEPNGQRKKEFG